MDFMKYPSSYVDETFLSLPHHTTKISSNISLLKFSQNLHQQFGSPITSLIDDDIQISSFRNTNSKSK